MGIHAGDDLALLGRRRHGTVEELVGGVPAGGRVVDLPLHGADPLGQLGGPLLRGLAALHDFEDDVLQVALALGEGGDLALEVLQVLRRGDRAGVQALLVADRALTHLVHVLLGLGLLAGGVALLGLRGDEEVTQLGQILGQRVDLGVLGQRPALVGELLEAESRAWTSRSRIWSAGAAFSWGLQWVDVAVEPRGRSRGR